MRGELKLLHTSFHSLCRGQMDQDIPAFLPQIGSRWELWWPKEKKYFPGKIIGIEGDLYVIDYDDQTQGKEPFNRHFWKPCIEKRLADEEELEGGPEAKRHKKDSPTFDELKKSIVKATTIK